MSPQKIGQIVPFEAKAHMSKKMQMSLLKPWRGWINMKGYRVVGVWCTWLQYLHIWVTCCNLMSLNFSSKEAWWKGGFFLGVGVSIYIEVNLVCGLNVSRFTVLLLQLCQIEFLSWWKCDSLSTGIPSQTRVGVGLLDSLLAVVHLVMGWTLNDAKPANGPTFIWQNWEWPKDIEITDR